MGNVAVTHEVYESEVLVHVSKFEFINKKSCQIDRPRSMSSTCLVMPAEGETMHYDSLHNDGLDDIGVLIIQNDPNMRFSVHQQLDQRNARVFEAESVEEAMHRIESFPVDVIVCDLTVPENDGFELMRRMRCSGRALPVLALASTEAVSVRDAAFTAGFQELLAKPVSIAQLVAVVRRLAGSSRCAHH